MYRKCRRDANEKLIVEALRKAGATVEFLDLTDGPDLLVGYYGRNYLLEIKRPKGELSTGQVEWHNKWRGQSNIVRSIDDALEWVGINQRKAGA
jgi:hypothetical protein